MAIHKQSWLDNFSRGSDSFLHTVQMAFAGARRLVIVCALAFLGIFAALVVLNTNAVQREILTKHYLAATLSNVGINVHLSLHLPDGEHRMKATDLAALTQDGAREKNTYLIISLLLSLCVAALVGRFIYSHHVARGSREAEDVFLRGQTIVSEETLAKMTEADSKLKLRIGKVAIPDRLLARNLAFVGNMGSGKSQSIFNLLDSAESLKLVVYDKTGEYVEKYFSAERGDIILNPFDVRCAPWSIFSDIKSEVDYTTIATYFVIKSEHDSNPVFVNAARLLLEDVLKLVQLEPGLKKTMGEVARIIFTTPLADLVAYLQKHGLPSGGLLNPDNVKTSEGVRFQLISQLSLRYFKLLDSEQPSFSIRDYVVSDRSGWLFLTSHAEQQTVIRPFASVWFEIAMLAAMGRPPINETRLMFVLDEVASLEKLPALETVLTEGRKYGISTLLGFQHFGQMDHLYGPAMTRVLLSGLQTKVYFRTDDLETSKIISETLGKMEIEEISAGVNLGLESSKDTSSLNRKRDELPLVMPEQIRTMPDLQGFLKVAGNFPIAKVLIPYTNRPARALGHEKRALPALLQIPEVVLQNDALPPSPPTSGLGSIFSD